MSEQILNAEALATQLFTHIRVEPSTSATLPPEKLNRISDELVYLSIFLIDLGVYLSLGDNEDRRLTMNYFWDIIGNSGLNTDVLNQRLQEYSEAAKADSHEDSLARLGQTFAWHCLAQDNHDIILFGANETQSILQEIVEVVSSAANRATRERD